MSDFCANEDERLVSVLYEDGDPAELEATRAHLATCASCRAEFERLRATRELLGAWPDPAPSPGLARSDTPSSGAGGGAPRRPFRPGSFLPSLAAAAAVVLLLGLSLPFLRLRIRSDGTLGIAFATSSASAPGTSGFVTRGDLDRELARTAEYLEAWVRSGREEDRRALLAVVDHAFQDQNAELASQVAVAIDAAFDDIDQQRRADLGVLLATMDDLQVITGTELQRMNAVLASLAPRPPAEQE